MARNTARTLGFTLLAVLVIAVAASGFTGAIEAGPLEDFGLGNAESTQTPGDSDQNAGIIAGRSAQTTLGLPLFCISHPVFVYGVPVLVFGGVVYLFDRFDTWIGSRMAVGFGLLVGIPYAVLVACPQPETGLAAPSDLGSVFSRAGTDLPTPLAATPYLLLGALVVGVVGIAVIIHRLRGESMGEAGRGFRGDLLPRHPNPGTDLAGVADAAGSAADRLEGRADVDNEVYRAWREMTAYLDVDRPAASTPREFEAAAIEAGLAPADVSALTRVFEAVRYGTEDPDLHADEAVAALRRIEAAAAAEGSAGAVGVAEPVNNVVDGEGHADLAREDGDG